MTSSESAVATPGTAAGQGGPRDDVLCCVGLSKTLGGRRAVDAVSLGLRRGSVHALLGPNGAGKTTVLRMLLGVVRPDAGTIQLDGSPLGWAVPRGRCGIAGFVDSPSFYPYLTASRNLELLSAWDGPGAHRRVEELLELVGLTGRAQSKVRGFSTGMRQRLGLAAALISDPRVLIVDEPTAGLDPAGIRDLRTLLAGLAESGRTILLSSHDLDEVEKLCTDVTVLRSGSVVYDGTLAALIERAPGRRWRLESSDDVGAVSLATDYSGLEVRRAEVGEGLVIDSRSGGLDEFVIALGARGIAVRELRREGLPLESLFFQLTEKSPPTGAVGDRP